MSSSNDTLFETESGKFLTSIALKVSALESSIIKNKNPDELIEFYNKLYNTCIQFEDEINQIEKKILGNDDE